MEQFSYSYRVGIGDINVGGHVSNAAVLTIFQDARLAFLAQLGPFSETEVGGCGLIMPEAHIYYRQEMFHGDQLQIGVRVAGLKRAAFTLEYQITRAGEVTAEGTTVMVCFDYQQRKPCRMPPQLRAALESLPLVG
ncbi:acyl-CoA thioesterase [Pelovirga terrestris]|uniref:Acyl-CoA thioesterase n=1 Tax=Pelovirga terrestris TaxID=2771352 RepID=A0A8J6QUZ5_9BACT|nr:thioesterase family protein [Pelovirga terrestris]MBD1401000.1 acyl-CoA thioesterase [Pelovirga terrestris]